MSVMVYETFVLEGNKGDIKRFCSDMNLITENVLLKAEYSKEDFRFTGLPEEYWETYSEEVNKIYPIEKSPQSNKFNHSSGNFTCDNFLTVTSLSDSLFYTFIKCSCVGEELDYRKLARKYYPNCHYYFFDRFENGACITNDINGRYFRVKQRGPIYCSCSDFDGYVTEDEFLEIAKNMYHNHSLEFDDIKDSPYHEMEFEAHDEIKFDKDDRVTVNGSSDDIYIDGISFPILDPGKNDAQTEKELTDFLLKIKNDDFIDYTKYPEYKVLSKEFVFGGTPEGNPSGILYGIKQPACKNDTVIIPDGIVEIAESAFDFGPSNGKYTDERLRKLSVPSSLRKLPWARNISFCNISYESLMVEIRETLNT